MSSTTTRKPGSGTTRPASPVRRGGAGRWRRAFAGRGGPRTVSAPTVTVLDPGVLRDTPGGYTLHRIYTIDATWSVGVLLSYRHNTTASYGVAQLLTPAGGGPHLVWLASSTVEIQALPAPGPHRVAGQAGAGVSAVADALAAKAADLLRTERDSRLDQVLIVTRGLPGCGKTTRARAWVAQDPGHRARVGRDAIRSEVFCSRQFVLGPLETVVSTVQHQMIGALLDAGLSVVADDTNLPGHRIDGWRRFADRAGVRLEVWDMTGVGVEECIRRDKARAAAGGHLIGEKAIRDAAARGGATWDANDQTGRRRSGSGQA
jgi:predicted kinase